MNRQALVDHHAMVWAAYQRMRIRLADQINRELNQETGLSEAGFEILAALADYPEEPVRATALRCGLEWEKSRLSHQLRRMELRGLVIREPCAEDNRSSVVRITATGRQLANRAREVHEQAVKQLVFDVLTPAQAVSLHDIAETLLANLDQPQDP